MAGNHVRAENRPPSPRQFDVLRFLARHLDEHGYPPTRREICRALGIAPSGLNAAHDHLRGLERKGLVRCTPLVSRGITITAAGRQLLRGDDGATSDETCKSTHLVEHAAGAVGAEGGS